DDVAGDANHEEIAKPLVEDELGRHAGIRAAENDGERLLTVDQRRASRVTRRGRERGLAADKASIALSKARERLGRSQHASGYLISLTSNLPLVTLIGGDPPSVPLNVPAMRFDDRLVIDTVPESPATPPQVVEPASTLTLMNPRDPGDAN